MSTLVTNELFAQPGRGDDVANQLLEILGESLQHDGCQTIRILRDQDDRITSPDRRSSPTYERARCWLSTWPCSPVPHRGIRRPRRR
jgi:hypothetical protein